MGQEVKLDIGELDNLDFGLLKQQFKLKPVTPLTQSPVNGFAKRALQSSINVAADVSPSPNTKTAQALVAAEHDPPTTKVVRPSKKIPYRPSGTVTVGIEIDGAVMHLVGYSFSIGGGIYVSGGEFGWYGTGGAGGALGMGGSVTGGLAVGFLSIAPKDMNGPGGAVSLSGSLPGTPFSPTGAVSFIFTVSPITLVGVVFVMGASFSSAKAFPVSLTVQATATTINPLIAW